MRDPAHQGCCQCGAVRYSVSGPVIATTLCHCVSCRRATGGVSVAWAVFDKADVAVVFYSPDAVKIKKLDAISYEQIAQSFKRDDLIIYTNPDDFRNYLFNLELENTALLLMSSGNYGGLNFDEVKGLIG